MHDHDYDIDEDDEYTFRDDELDPEESDRLSDKIANIIDDVLGDYCIRPDQVFSMMSDNASYMSRVYSLLMLKYFNMTHITCFSHIIHLVICSMISKLSAAKDFLYAVKG